MVNAQLTAALKNAKGNWISERQAGRLANLSSLMLEREVDRLRDAGYEIEAAGLRLRMTNAPDLLFADEIRCRLDTERIGSDVIVEREVSSTNDVAWKYAAEGARDGFVVLAERQTNGRGRIGRQWYSPDGGLWMSIVLRPNLERSHDGGTFGRAALASYAAPQDLPEQTSALTIGASVAVARAISAWPGCRTAIKWPNDILIDGKKAAGLMVETQNARSLQGTFILGIGVNSGAGEFPDDIREIATSMAEHTEKPVLRADLACAILQNFDDIYRQILQCEYTIIGEEWKRMSSTIGHHITIRQNSRTYTGEVVDLDPAAGLLVRLKSGFVRAFKGEHVTVVK